MLRLGKIQIRDARFGKETRIKDGVLYIKKKELLEVAKANDERLSSVQAHIARPGDSVRIIPIKDVIEPRFKKTDADVLALKGISVITCGQIVGFQEGLLDMSGPGAEYSSFSKLTNIVLVVKATKGITQHQHEEAIRLLGQRAADYLGQAAKEIIPEDIEEFAELSPHEEDRAGLPRVVYVYMLL
ncbi:MAG: beta-aspartyl-peptidase, partial [Candidatus Nealsonbacteria bacterium]|nr:beta-aspartyl-peptidase [Candidatus Nealsonbacteria bacterium]